jgi:hypothetical protein
VGVVVAERSLAFDHSAKTDRRLFAGVGDEFASGVSIARRAMVMPWFWFSLSPLWPATAPSRASAEAMTCADSMHPAPFRTDFPLMQKNS